MNNERCRLSGRMKVTLKTIKRRRNRTPLVRCSVSFYHLSLPPRCFAIAYCPPSLEFAYSTGVCDTFTSTYPCGYMTNDQSSTRLGEYRSNLTWVVKGGFTILYLLCGHLPTNSNYPINPWKLTKGSDQDIPVTRRCHLFYRRYRSVESERTQI